MADYAKAASDFKSRLDAKAKRAAEFDAFWEQVRDNLYRSEREKANAALAVQSAPLIEAEVLFPGDPGPADTTLSLAGSTCIVSRTPENVEKPAIEAKIKTESSEKSVTFLLLLDESPATAKRVSLAPAAEPKADAAQVAAAILEEFIAEAP